MARNPGWNSVHTLAVFGSLLTILLGTSGCRGHSGASEAAGQNAQSAQQQTHAGNESEKSCRQFVQGFYDWYFDLLNTETKRQTGGPIDYEALRLKPQFFTPELRQMLQEDAKAAAKNPGYIMGLDFDPFINAQDWEGKYQVNNVAVKDTACRANVWGTDGGTKLEIVDPELRMSNGQWTFVNFHYPDSTGKDEDLVAILTSLRSDREATTSKAAHE